MLDNTPARLRAEELRALIAECEAIEAEYDALSARLLELRARVADARGETPPTCVECRRPWFDPAERWRSYLTVDDETALYCPGCAEVFREDG
jgi:hypothetical protein